FFFQAEDGIRAFHVTGVQTCALPICNSFFAYLGGVADWPLTDAGRAAMSGVDPRATPQKDCIPIAAPGLLFYPVANTVTVEEDRVVMHIYWMDVERVSWLVGRDPPPADKTFMTGHSVGL